MVRNKIYAIVEGHGEAKPPTPGQLPAVYVLMNKLLLDLHCWTLFPAIKAVPWRMFSSGDFFAKGKLEQIIRAHKKEEDCAVEFCGSERNGTQITLIYTVYMIINFDL